MARKLCTLLFCLVVPLLLLARAAEENSAPLYKVRLTASLRVDASVGKTRRFAGGFQPHYLEVPQGQWVTIEFASLQGTHALSIPDYEVETPQVSEGQVAYLRFWADKAGEFPMLCKAKCGEFHREMKGVLIVSAED